MNEMQSTSGESTPITPDGLRGLGMRPLSVSEWVVGLPNRRQVYLRQVDTGWRMNMSLLHIGTAPDLEWVETMIGLLRRANGGEG